MAGTGLNPSTLPGEFKSRVFVGGSYQALPTPSTGGVPPRELLNQICHAVRAVNLHPIVADEFVVFDPDHNIHHDAIFLLHSCRCAIFELSEFSGALMEI